MPDAAVGAALRLPTPAPGPDAAARWVATHLADLAGDDAAPSPRFRGGQEAADAALAAFTVRGYAARRNEVWPRQRRGASALSPYIRHGLLPLQRVWAHVAAGPARDVAKFRDELLWQEYARHLYARLGAHFGESLRGDPPRADAGSKPPWPDDMACIALTRGELVRDGWLVNQSRMWLASQWSVRHGARWQDGEDVFFRHLLDGSRAANRLGWQWTVGSATGKAYGFSRWQVEKRASGLCEGCALRIRCPIQEWPADSASDLRSPMPRLERDPALESTRGPEQVDRRGEPDRVWLTAESLGDADPALRHWPALGALFVFDAPLLSRLRLSRKRLIFLVETLAALAQRRDLAIWRGAPESVLAEGRLAVTFAPVPGWRRIADRVVPAAVHPWPWLVSPVEGPIRSFSQWRRATGGLRKADGVDAA